MPPELNLSDDNTVEDTTLPTSTDAVVPTPTRKRGRPRKSDGAPAAPPSSEPVVKRPRGRPPKAGGPAKAVATKSPVVKKSINGGGRLAKQPQETIRVRNAVVDEDEGDNNDKDSPGRQEVSLPPQTQTTAYTNTQPQDTFAKAGASPSQTSQQEDKSSLVDDNDEYASANEEPPTYDELQTSYKKLWKKHEELKTSYARIRSINEELTKSINGEIANIQDRLAEMPAGVERDVLVQRLKDEHAAVSAQVLGETGQGEVEVVKRKRGRGRPSKADKEAAMEGL